MKTVLVLLDSKPMMFILQKMLEDLGFSVFVRSNLTDAQDLLNQDDKIDAVLLDKTIHAEPTASLIQAFPHVKFIYVSNQTEPSDIQTALDLGAAEYIMKPFDHDILQSKLSLAGLL